MRRIRATEARVCCCGGCRCSPGSRIENGVKEEGVGHRRIRQDRQPDARKESGLLVTADRSGGGRSASLPGPSGAQHRRRYQIGHNLIVPEIAALMRLAGFPSRSPPVLALALTVCPSANIFAVEGQDTSLMCYFKFLLNTFAKEFLHLLV